MSEMDFEEGLPLPQSLDQGKQEDHDSPDSVFSQDGNYFESEAAEAACLDEVRAAQELEEHNALARVFDDVRSQSANSNLVQPERWAEIGLVPDHLSAEDFEMLVYEYLEEYRAEREQMAVEQEPTPVFRTATRAVGVPMMFRKDEPEQEEMTQPATVDLGDIKNDESAPPALEPASSGDCGGTASASDPAERAADQPFGEQMQNAGLSSASDATEGSGFEEVTSPEGVADESSSEQIVSERAQDTEPLSASDADNPFAGLNLPDGFELMEVEGEYTLVPTEEETTPVELTVECENIAVLTGAYNYYLYDRTFMTDAYAHWSFLAAEDNRVITFVDCVREDSRVYPRPLAATSLENPPFSMSAEEVAETWEIVQATGAYPDLGKTVASNGDVYYYSTDYLSHTYAASLAEWDAVERKMNY